jgi:CPA2 family monovalent cation:H+ antiporter-2
MAHEVDLILTLTASLAAALVLGLVTRRLGLSPIVGYLLAGIAVGPFTPGYVANAGLAGQLAEIGVILLMFGVGLSFRVSELLAVKGTAMPGALTGMLGTAALGSAAARALGMTLSASVVFGVTIAVASTVVLLRVLADADATQTRIGHIAVGWLVVEDLATVLVLVALPLLAPGGTPRSVAEVAGAATLAVGKVVVLVAFIWYAGRRIIPALLGMIAKTRSRELFTLSVLVMALGIAVGAAKLFGASMALGAFLAGLVVGQSEFSSRAASEALPMRDAFAVLFFVSVGMMFDPRSLGSNSGLIAVSLAIVLAGKPLLAFGVMRLRGQPSAVALPVAAALGQIGEFSFVLAGLGRTLGLVSERSLSALVVVSIVSITVSPLSFRAARSRARRLGPAPASAEAPSNPDRYRAIVVGHGPVGRSVTRLLREHHIDPTVIDLNHETVARLKSDGVAAVYGDASRDDILVAAGVGTAVGLILTAPSMPVAAIVTAAIRHNARLVVLARASFLADARVATESGATYVACDELEVASALTEQVLVRLGATADQLDQARSEVRRSLIEPD